MNNRKFSHHLLTLMSFQTCTSFFLMLNIKEDILMNAGIQTVDGPHWLPLYFFPNYRSQWGLTTLIFQNSFVFNIRKKLIQVWNDMKVSKWQQNLNFCVNYSFNSSKQCFPCVILNIMVTIVFIIHHIIHLGSIRFLFLMFSLFCSLWLHLFYQK